MKCKESQSFLIGLRRTPAATWRPRAGLKRDRQLDVEGIFYLPVNMSHSAHAWLHIEGEGCGGGDKYVWGGGRRSTASGGACRT